MKTSVGKDSSSGNVQNQRGSSNMKVGMYPLIVVDVMKSCCSKKYERPEINVTYSKTREMIPRLRGFTDQYREMSGQIIWIRTTPWTRDFVPDNVQRLYRENPSATFYTEKDADESVEFCDGINPRKPDRVFVKNTYSAFANKELQKFIQKHKWDTYLLAGIFADGCVNATLVHGFANGFFTIILSDLVESMDDEEQQANKRYLLTHQWPLMYGHVMTSDEFLKKLVPRRRHS